jgi:large conductance mechanosensitive channel
MKKLFKEFAEFVNKGNALALAIGVIIGGAFTAIVTAINKQIISPLLGWILGGYNLALTIDRTTGECVSLSTLLMALGFFAEQEINITDYKKGKLIYHNNLLKEQAGAHQEFIRKFYYDRTKNLLCFGINDNTCDTVKFESHTYAKVKSGKLYAIIIEVDKQIINQLKKIVINSYKQWFKFGW